LGTINKPEIPGVSLLAMFSGLIYDSLNRLATATGSGGESYGFDGYGKLLSKAITAATAPVVDTAGLP